VIRWKPCATRFARKEAGAEAVKIEAVNGAWT